MALHNRWSPLTNATKCTREGHRELDIFRPVMYHKLVRDCKENQRNKIKILLR